MGESSYPIFRSLDHLLAALADKDRIRRQYQLWVRGMPMGPPEKDELLPGNPAYAYSNTFRIVGGPTLYKKEIAILTAGTLGAMVLVMGTVVVAVRVLRRRREGTVAL